MHVASNDQRLFDFPATKNLVISATFLPYKDVHERAFASPDGRTFNHIDHLLIDKIVDVLTYRRSSCGNRSKIERGAPKSNKFNIVRLKSAAILDGFLQRIKTIHSMAQQP